MRVGWRPCAAAVGFNYLYGPPLSKDDQTGFYDQILIEAFRRIGQPMQITHLPTERSITNANLGITDGEFPRISGLDRLYPNLLQVPEKIDDFKFTAFTWRDDIQLKNGAVVNLTTSPSSGVGKYSKPIWLMSGR